MHYALKLVNVFCMTWICYRVVDKSRNQTHCLSEITKLVEYLKISDLYISVALFLLSIHNIVHFQAADSQILSDYVRYYLHQHT